ncbi:MAG: regulatory protein RecX [Sphingobacteriaceae bacterium]
MENESAKRKTYTPQQARVKAESYCAYQERSQQEMRDKLYQWGLHYSDVEQTISELIQSNFLNEERFAMAYAQGKFRIKGWGKRKIKQALKFKQVPEKLILKALNNLDADEYLNKLADVIDKKMVLIKETDAFKRRYQLSQFAQMRGFEPDLIAEVLKDKGL